MTFSYFFNQFIVLLNYSEQDQESVPAPAPDCLCHAYLPSWLVTPLMNRTSPNILLLRKVLLPGSLHLLVKTADRAGCGLSGSSGGSL